MWVGFRPKGSLRGSSSERYTQLVVQESRRARRAARGKRQSGTDPSQALAQADALKPGMLRSMFLRLGLIVLGVWIVGATIAGFSTSTTVIGVALAIPAVLTVGMSGLAIWAVRRARSAQGVAGILSGVKSEEDRKRALEQLSSDFKSSDSGAILARAQLQLQDDPRAALATLEQIDLNKAMAPVADEARGQRGMIHLMLGEVNAARDLADGIDLSRHQDSRTRAMLSSVIAEAWARSGQAKKAVKTIELYNPEEELYQALRPQLYRARAFAFAYAGNPKEMRRALRRMAQLDPRLLGGFLVKKTHPLLQKEAKQLLERSGQVERRMQIQRH